MLVNYIIVTTLNLPLIVDSQGLMNSEENIYTRAGLRFLTGRRFLDYVETYGSSELSVGMKLA